MSVNDSSSSILTPELLSCLDKKDLIDLLLHKTQLFIAAANINVADNDYFQTLRNELENIHSEIKKRENNTD